MKLYDLARYGLLGGIALTANANRRHYHMTTTWLPHFLTNTLTLLLPDACRLLPHTSPHAQPSTSAFAEVIQIANETLQRMTCGNPRYVVYVTPLALGYVTSHPQFNIYKGDLAELRLAGFGLDAIPHSATGFALTMLVCDTAHVAATVAPRDGRFAALLNWCDQHQTLVSAAAIVLATALWESGEYTIHRQELAQRGSIEAINMQWSVEDTVFDCFSNIIGWGLATAWRSRSG